MTGVDVDGHGLYANDIAVGGELQLADRVGPAKPTIFDAVRAAGRTSSCVVGDHHLIGAMAATRAHHHWPPNGEKPDDGPYDVLGYVADDITVLRIIEAIDTRPDFLFTHLNEPDTAGHVFGPGQGPGDRCLQQAPIGAGRDRAPRAGLGRHGAHGGE